MAGLTGCSSRGDDEPHQAILYNICDVEEAGENASVFHLYRPDANEPVVLSAPGFSAADDNGMLPKPGTSGMLAYYPTVGKPYTDSEIVAAWWAKIYNFSLNIPSEDEEEAIPDLTDTEAVQYLAGWRGGNKLYMRLRLPYSTIARRFGLVADPATLDTPVPTIYLLHERSNDTPTFDRQYYFAFDITPLWERPSVEGVRLMVNDNLSGGIKEFLFYKKS